MNYLIEHIVKEYQHHHDAFGSFCRIAVEVYIAYLLERLIERFHEAIWKLLEILLRKVNECREAMTTGIIPGILATIKKVLAKLLLTAKRLWEKVQTFFG